MSAVNWESAPPFGRRETILHALRLLAGRKPGPAVIVETGTIRDSGGSAMSGDGWSTVAWAWYCSQAGGRAYTVDVNAGAIQTCRTVTADWAQWIEYVTGDSVSFLAEWPAGHAGAIDLLYLDSLDYHDHEASERHSLAEAQAALPHMSEAGLILFDDTHGTGNDEGGRPTYWGKGRLAVPHLLSCGCGVVLDTAGQVLLSV